VVAAWIAYGQKSTKKAEELMRAAADRETASGKDPVEPGHVISAVEELGDLLVELKHPDQALQAFQTALKESPRRLNALYGAGRAAELAGKKDDAKTYYTQLIENTTDASTRPARAAAQKALAPR
jgi:tetratricopeptide (TPR) repeat protein